MVGDDDDHLSSRMTSPLRESSSQFRKSRQEVRRISHKNQTDSILVKESTSYQELQCIVRNGVVVGNKKCTVKVPAEYKKVRYLVVITPAKYKIVQKESKQKIIVLT